MIVGNSNYPSEMPSDASKMFGNNLVNFFKLIVNDSGNLNLDFGDDIVNETCLTHQGEITDEKIKEIIQKSFPMMLSSVMYVVFLRSDKLIISFFDTASNLGIYSLAVKIATFSVIFLSAANQILAPKISATYSQGNKERMINVINTGTKLVFWFSLPLIILLVIFSDFILGIFGPEFIEGKNALLILLVGFLANILSGPVGQVLQMTNREKVFQNIMVISAILNVILNFILIPFYGIVGAAISTTLCNIFWNLVSVYKIKKDLEVSTLYNPLKL